MARMSRGVSRRKLIALLCAGSLSALVGACGGATANAPTTSQSTPASNPTVPPAARPTTEAQAPAKPTSAAHPTTTPAAQAQSSSSTTTISYWHIWGGARTKQLQAILDDFQKANPAIKVQPLLIPNPGYQDKIIPALAGSPPDLTMVYTDVFAPAAKQGALRRTDDWISRDKIDPQAFYDGVWNLVLWHGVPYGLPYIGNFIYLLYWNKAMFKEAGLDPEKAPETWDDMLAATKKLTVLTNGKLERMGYQTGPNDFRHGVYNNGATILDPSTGKSTVKDPKAVAAMNFSLQLVDAQGGNDKIAAATQAFKDAQLNDPLEARKGAMITSGVFTINLINQQTPTLSYSVGKIPHGPNGQSRDLVMGSWNNSLPTKGKNADQAWTLATYLSYGKGHQDFMRVQDRPAMVRKYNEPPNDEFYKKNNPFWATVLEVMNLTVSYPVSDKLGQIDRSVNEAYDNVVAKKMTPEQAVDWLDEQITAATGGA
jgi:multiple sugar transport system substrate-binding protein